MEFGGVFVVDVDGAFAVGDSEFGLAAERNCAGDGTVRCVDNGGIFAAAVKGEDVLRGGVVDDRIGIGVSFYCAQCLQSFQIENGGGVGAAVTGEAATEVGSDGDAMDALCVGNVAFDGVVSAFITTVCELWEM